jgi:pyruvate carboxylase subunit B
MKEEAMPSAVPAPSASGAALPDLPMEFSVDVDGEVFNVKVASVLGKTILTEGAKKSKDVPPGSVVSSMQGMILGVKVKVGDKVKQGDVLLTIEAMKMQNNISAPHGGTVKEIRTFQGEVVNSGDVLIVIDANG